MTREIASISASGALWVGYEASNIVDTVFDSLKQARTSIQISAFSLGRDNFEMKTFFDIIQDQINAGCYVQFIVNDLEGSTIGDFSRQKLIAFQKFSNFDLFNFQIKHKYGSLHAKIIVIDRKFALIGSPNISKNAMNYNYEIMLKINGNSVSKIANMLDVLARSIKQGDDL